MRSFTLIQKRAYLQGVISDEKKVELLKIMRNSRATVTAPPSIERFSTWNEKQIDAAINAHIRSTVARLTDPSLLEQRTGS